MKTLTTLLVLIGFTFVYDTTSGRGLVYVNNSSQSGVYLIYPGNHCVFFSESRPPFSEKCDETIERFQKMNPNGIKSKSYIVPAEGPK